MTDNQNLQLFVDPGFVHHRMIETILGEKGTELIEKKINEINLNTPEWRKLIVIDHIYTRIMLAFCEVHKINTLEELLFQGSGHLFCSIVKTQPCEDFYDVERAEIRCIPFEGCEYSVELHLTTKRATGDTLRSQLQQGGEFAIIARFYRKDNSTLIFHPLVIGFPLMQDADTSEAVWIKYTDHYQVFLEQFEEFSLVKDHPLPDSHLEMQQIKETAFKACLGKHLSESTPKDWGGESSDFFTSHLHIDGQRVSAAFLLKGRSKYSPMKLSHLGSNSDQIVRLSKESADVLVVQHCHDILPVVLETLKVFATQPSNPRRYCVVDGRESLRFLKACSLFKEAVALSEAP